MDFVNQIYKVYWYIESLALMEMESLDEINLFFLALAERPEEAPASSIEKKVYEEELVINSRELLQKKIMIRRIK